MLFVIGSNTKENHPIIALKMIKAKRKGAKIIIADPRRVPLVRFADIWMQQKPGTDVALLERHDARDHERRPRQEGLHRVHDGRL